MCFLYKKCLIFGNCMKQSYEMVEFLSEKKLWSPDKSNKNHSYTM